MSALTLMAGCVYWLTVGKILCPGWAKLLAGMTVGTAQVAFDFDSAVLETLPHEVSHAVSTLAQSDDIDSRGAVFTRVEVVEFVLDLVGYIDDQPLSEKRLLEPSCGAGDFLLPAIERLLASWRRTLPALLPEVTLRDAICAVELHADSAG